MNICELLENSNTQSNEDEETSVPLEEQSQQQEKKSVEQETPGQTDACASGTPGGSEDQAQVIEVNRGDLALNLPSEPENNVVKTSETSEDQEMDAEQNNLKNMLIDYVEQSSTSNETNTEENSNQLNSYSQNSGDQQNNIDFGQSILTSNSTVNDEFNFDRLGPFEKLCSLCDNPTPSNMESASKYLVPALEFCSTQDDFMRVFSYLRKYCFFSDVLLRSLWLEQIQNIIQYISQEGDNIIVEFKDNFNIPNELALLISDLMYEPTYQVKKYATASLLCIVEKQLLNNEQIEKIIIPSLLNLVKENNEDFHIDCVSLFGKLAPLVGRDLTAKYFLQPFCRLSTSPVFHTRKACASNITEIANMVTTEQIEEYLIPQFCEFMKDQVWAIRKVCADIFSSFAVKCRRKTREEVLTEYFIRLLDDNSRWVKISAYKSLGSFIATFSQDKLEKADELKSSTDDENNIADNPEAQPENEESKAKATDTKDEKKDGNDSNSGESIENNESSDSASPEEITEYNNFNYWRNSIPSLEEAVELADEKKTNVTDSDTSGNKTISATSNLATDSKLDSMEAFHQAITKVTMYGVNYSGLYTSTNQLYSNPSQQNTNRITDLNQLSKELKQDVVPSILLSYFITMIDMNAQNSLDSEMNYNCAFNFPAIALTLGVANWKFVRDLYKKLAEDNNWKVRQTLAYSIHELALILGTECTQSELVPVFDSFIKDVDEVRMGIVSNLSKFLGALSLEFRRSYMPKLNDFLKMDNQRNWRFRNELGLQIAQFCELFPSDCIAEYIQPVTFILALDKVAEVRLTSIKALTVIFRQFEEKNEKKYRADFLNDVIRSFADNNKWSFRQLFVFLCENIFKEKAYKNLEAFSNDVLPKLFSMRTDVVANIRVCLARVITTYILNLEFFTNGKNPISNDLNDTILWLNRDKESDVRGYFSCADDCNESSSLPPYEEATNYVSSAPKREETASNEPKIELNEYEIHHDDRLNDSMNLINAQVMSYNGTHEDVVFDEDDDEDDDDEVIDTTKVGQLKIVNELDNDMEDDSDEVIDTTPMSPDTIPMKMSTENSLANLNNDIERTTLKETVSGDKINFPAPLTASIGNEECKTQLVKS